jgi:hypothetical protein
MATFDFDQSYSPEPLRRQLLERSASYAFTAISYVVFAILTRQGDGIEAIPVAAKTKPS